jgi:hypothetical protein
MMKINDLTTFSNDEYYQHSVIKPPEDSLFYEGDTRFTRIVVDSKDRNLTLFSSPNQYDVAFDDDINDVISAQLINIQLPLQTYLVNMYFNTINITVAATSYNIILSIGDYTAAGLAAEIKTQLNSASTGNTFDVAYNTSTDNFSIMSSGSFSIDFTTKNSLAMMLGYKNILYTSVTTVPTNGVYPYMIKSQFRKNFDFNNYAVMFIDQFDVNKNINNPINKSFAIIGSDYNSLNISDEPNIIKHFSPPINKLSKLKISFCDRFGNPYDFQNMDHRFELLFKSHKQRRKYMAVLKNHYGN